MPDAYCVIFSTTGSREEADRIAEMLVTRKLAACVQISAISSVYAWHGELHKDAEHLLLIKTVPTRYDDIQAAILENHSYEVPEIVQLPIENGLPAYLAWISENTSSAGVPRS
jgi:periplasmic divalent cation tolerance protein